MKKITISIPWPWDLRETQDVILFAFRIALYSYIICVALDTAQTGAITAFYCISWLVWVVIITGTISLLLTTVVPLRGNEKNDSSALWLPLMIGVALGATIYFRLQAPMIFVRLLSFLGGLIAFGITRLVFQEPHLSQHTRRSTKKTLATSPDEEQHSR